MLSFPKKDENICDANFFIKLDKQCGKLFRDLILGYYINESNPKSPQNPGHF